MNMSARERNVGLGNLHLLKFVPAFGGAADPRSLNSQLLWTALIGQEQRFLNKNRAADRRSLARVGHQVLTVRY